MTKTLDVLFVEDSANDAKLLLLELRRGGWEIVHERVDTRDAMQTALNAKHWDIIIADYSMPSFSGTSALALARERAVDVPFILVSGRMGEETAVEAMKAGADDYLFKGDLKRLVPVVTRELKDADVRRNARCLKTELHKREAQLLDAQRLAHLGTWHADLKTGAAVWSDETCRMLGMDACNEIQTLSQLTACLQEDDRNEFEALLREDGPTIIERDCQLSCSKPSSRFVHLRGEIIRNANGVALEAGGMIQDVTERHLAEAQIKQAKEAAESASRAKSEFLANMSHEIRTPMTAILGFIEMLAQPGQSPTERTECIQTVRRNAVHLLELINDILDLSKIEAGGMTVECIACDIGKLVGEIVAIMQPRALEKGLKFDVSFTRPIPAQIQTDPLRLRQILTNLLGNAIKFTTTGQVRIRLDSEQVDSRTIFKVDVVDSGIGLTIEQISRLFQPFTQAEESTTRKFGGTGLGLTISQQLAKLLGGEISVQSQAGVGSTFSLRINAGSASEGNMLTDLEQAKTNAVKEGEWQEFSLSGRILLVEDGRDNQRLLSNHLRASGADVLIAENGQIATELVAAQPFDLILMDMQMPVMDGYTAASLLRKRGVKTPIIALTAFAMAEDRDKCTASGCTDYLSKPIDRTLLLSTVQHYFQSTQPAAQVVSTPLRLAPSSKTIKSQLINYPGMKGIIAEFVEGLPAEVQKINDFLLGNDMDSLRRIAHQFRGSGGGYGFDELTVAAAEVEKAIKGGEPTDTIAHEVDELLDVIYRIDGFDRNHINHFSISQTGASNERIANLHCGR